MKPQANNISTYQEYLVEIFFPNFLTGLFAAGLLWTPLPKA
jgi:hypothetical protein